MRPRTGARRWRATVAITASRSRRRFGRAVLCAAAIASAAACGGGGGGGPTTPPALTITFMADGAPGANAVYLDGTGGSSLTVAVRAQEVRDLYGIAFDLSFPAAALRLAGATEGTFLAGDASVPTTMQVSESPPGNLVVGLSRLGVSGGESGSGLLLTLTFSAAAAGGGELALRDRHAFAPNGREQTAVSWTDGRVEVAQ